MTDVVQNPDTTPAITHEPSRTGLSGDALRRGVVDHLRYSIGRPAAALKSEHYYRALALAVRDRMQDNRLASTQTSLDLGRKVTCYLSAEFLMGPQLGSNLLNLGIEGAAREALASLGQDLDNVLACEEEPGLGNGGLGRLAACYLDSLATLERPAIGYGIRYEFGIFDQEIHDGWQVEKTDNWLVNGNPWEIAKPDVNYLVKWGGYAEHYADDAGHDRVRWVPGRVLKGVAYDTPIQGYGVNTCNVLTLWTARAVQSFALDAFNTGDYYRRSRTRSTRKPSPRCSTRTTSPRRASAFACCGNTSSCRVLCSTCCTSSMIWPTCPLRTFPSDSRCSSPTPIPRSASPNSCGSWSTSGSCTGARRGRSRWRRSATPTTRCSRRRWRPGRWRCSPNHCPGTSRSSTRSTGGSSTRCAPSSRATMPGCAGCR